MQASVRAAVEQALGATVRSERPIGGGDINDAHEAVLSDGRTVFVKTNDRADRGMFPAEARGLAWLEEARALRLPKVLAVSGGEQHGPSFLVLEHLGSSAPVRGFDDELGRGLAALHRFGAPSFGLDHDNFIGRLPQANGPLATWPEFYRERRLAPQLERAERAGLADAGLHRSFDQLFARLEELCGPSEPPARLHGDLWGGNLHSDANGKPCLIDPAVYGGHREVDLAMMKLFGGFGERVFAAYNEAYPLAAGHAERVSLYQLYPLMVHVNLFGTSYLGSVKRAFIRYL
jgi:protein-ribulosamine 3-kinase